MRRKRFPLRHSALRKVRPAPIGDDLQAGCLVMVGSLGVVGLVRRQFKGVKVAFLEVFFA
jgi:hypothetical protein